MTERHITVAEYFSYAETNRRQELAYGVLREPPAPGFHHQLILGRLYTRLERHVRRGRLGHLVLSPVDVVLDREHALVVQPDLVFVSAARRNICTERIWGAPDLVVEILSKTNRRHDSQVKVGWYRRYGVLECWLVDPEARRIDVIDLADASEAAARSCSEHQCVRSSILPRLRLRPVAVFDEPEPYTGRRLR